MAVSLKHHRRKSKGDVMKLLVPTLIAAALFITGCSTTASSLNTEARAVNVNKFAGHNTKALIKSDGQNLTITFPKLDNNMGENFAKTACQSNFEYIESFKDLQSGNIVDVYGGKWKLSNNNCAHYVETTSASFTHKQQQRYLLVNKKSFVISYDKMGREALIEGNFQ